MKLRHFLFGFLSFGLLTSCQEPAKEKQHVNGAPKIDITWVDESGYTSEEQFTILTIDSCEYLFFGYDRSRSMTHKGNCKYCMARK